MDAKDLIGPGPEQHSAALRGGTEVDVTGCGAVLLAEHERHSGYCMERRLWRASNLLGAGHAIGGDADYGRALLAIGFRRRREPPASVVAIPEVGMLLRCPICGHTSIMRLRAPNRIGA